MSFGRRDATMRLSVTDTEKSPVSGLPPASLKSNVSDTFSRRPYPGLILRRRNLRLPVFVVTEQQAFAQRTIFTIQQQELQHAVREVVAHKG